MNQRMFGAAAVLTLALGVGATCAIFALVDAALLRPLPFPSPDRLVLIWELTEKSPRGAVTLNVNDWNQRNRTFDRIAAFDPSVGGMIWSKADGTAETISRQWVSAGVFDVLGIRALAGRTFLDADARDRADVVLLGEEFWRTRFNANPEVVGRSVRLDGWLYTIVGVVPTEAQVLGRASIWALAWNRFPLVSPPGTRSAYAAQVIGRLKPGVTLDAAAQDMSLVAHALAREFPQTHAGRGVTLDRLVDAVIGSELRQISILFLGVAGFVLLTCCTNASSLLLTGAVSRRRELAIRAALGADRLRMMRQLVTESLVVSAAGGVLGVATGAGILKVAPSIIPPDLLPATLTLSFDGRALAFCAAATLTIGLLLGIAAARQAAAFSPAQEIRSERRTTTPRGGSMRTVLVIGEVATAVMLLVAAGLLLRTLVKLSHVDRGYHKADALTMLVDPPVWSQVDMLQFYAIVERETRARPGVRSVAWATTLPMGRSVQGRFFFDIVGDPPFDDRTRRSADHQVVSPTYFETLDLPVVAGRGFTDRDTRDSVPICMVNEAFVRRHLHGRSAVGTRLAMRPAGSRTRPAVREIVGVARQVKGRPDETDDLLQIYVPLAQQSVGEIFMIVTPEKSVAHTIAPAVRAALAEVDNEHVVSVTNVATLDDIAREATARYRFRAALVMAFAALALLLAMVGVFGILAHSVEERVGEFALRRALGASTRDVLGIVAGTAARLIAVGVVVGFALSLPLGYLIGAMLFEVQPFDPAAFASAAVILALTAAASMTAPAWRATQIDPAIELQSR